MSNRGQIAYRFKASRMSPNAAVDVRDRRGFNGGNVHARYSLASDADFLRGAKRKVETATAHIGAAIVDAHPYRAPVPWILELDDAGIGGDATG